MSYDEKTAERVRRILSGRKDVVEKRMVGGLSFLVNGKMCCGVAGDALMVRVGREGRDQALTERHVRPMKLAGRPLAGFVCVDPSGFRGDAALAKWIERGLDVVLALSAEERAGKRPAPPGRRRRPVS